MITHLDFSDGDIDPDTDAVLRESFRHILGNDYSDELHLCRLGGLVENRFEQLRSCILDIAKSGCSGGVCANSVDVCREMRDIARLALEVYVAPKSSEVQK